jgi:hypothetical protein
MDVPLLWHFAISHFTEKARWALDWKGIPHARRMLSLDYPIRCGLRTGKPSAPEPSSSSAASTKSWGPTSARWWSPSAPPPGSPAPSTTWPAGLPVWGILSRRDRGGAARR